MKNQKSVQTVLYIEDDPASKRLLQAFIDNYDGIRLLTAWSAEEGLKLADEHQPELILLDINLPCMSGREAIVSLSKNPRLADTKIFALSADAIPDHIDSAMELGFHGYITKPVNLAVISNIFEKVLQPQGSPE